MKDTKRSDELLENEHDGIREYDNDLPRWWVSLFHLTIVISIGYTIYAHVWPGVNVDRDLSLQMTEIAAARSRAEVAASLGSGNLENDLFAKVSDTGAISAGKSVYAARCAACHGMNGEGLIGPNLTDDHWLHGGRIVEILSVVEKGVLDKGMLAWKGILKDEEIRDVTAFVWSIHGTNPSNAKAPQGEIVPR